MTPSNDENTWKCQQKSSAGRLIFAFSAILFICVAGSPASAGSVASCLSALTEKDAAALADPSGRILYSTNAQLPHVPASTLKILTALAALRSFGPSHRFSTDLFLDADAALFIRGSGDPMLTSEALNAMALSVSEKARVVKRVVVDHSYFSAVKVPGTGRSSKPYDAPVGALSANFNTVNIAVGPDGKLLSAESQTPLLRYALTRIARLGPIGAGRWTFIHSADEAALYTGELFAHFLAQNGVRVEGQVEIGTVPPGSVPLTTWQSPYTLEEVIERMMEFSNNFIANQLLMATGARELGPPGDLEKALEVMNDLAGRQLGLSTVRIAEGSGISRNNRISVSDMLVVLRHFAPYRHLLREDHGAVYKTGTLSGLRTRAGYLEPVPGKPYCFVLFVNEDIGRTDDFLRCLTRAVRSLH